MKKLIIALALLFSMQAMADTKISALPLATAASTGATDSFPFVSVSAGATERVNLSDIINLPTMVATYAPLASPTFTGTVGLPTVNVSGVFTSTSQINDSYSGITGFAHAMKFSGTPFATGTATTNKPLLFMEDAGTSTGWSTAGTYFGVNAKTGFVGNLADLQLNGVSQFKVTSAGVITGVGTGLTGTAAGLTAGSVTTIPNLSGPISSTGNTTSITAQTGTGTTFAMSASPTFTGTVAAAVINTTGSITTTSPFTINATSTSLAKIQSSSAGTPTIALQFLDTTSVVAARPNWQLGTNQTANGVLEVTPSTSDNGSTWSSTSAIQFAVAGSTGSYTGTVFIPGALGIGASPSTQPLFVKGGAASGTNSSQLTVQSSTANNTRISVAADNSNVYVITGGSSTNPKIVFTTNDNTTEIASITNAGVFSASGGINGRTALLIGVSAPTISSGFSSSGTTVSANNGAAAFTITIGSTPSSSGVIGLPTAATGWNCFCNDITQNASTSVFDCKQTATATNSATIANYSDIAVLTNWVASDILHVSCFAY